MTTTRIGLDTNVLARYFIDDAKDQGAATRRQREAARQLVDGERPLAVAKTVVLELEWVLRGYYALPPAQVEPPLRYLLTAPHIEVEDAPAVNIALNLMLEGFDFADALHHASYRHCDAVATFDDRRFAKRAQRKALVPRVVAP